MQMTFYRGMFLEDSIADTAIERITANGIAGNEGRWDMRFFFVNQPMKTLLDKIDLSTADTKSRTLDSQMVCACGDRQGAAYYALEHNKPGYNCAGRSYIIKMTAPIENLAVDGRDFLYPAFQMSKKKSSNIEMQKKQLSRLFGARILKYFEKAIETEEIARRIALCDLACQDKEVIEHHYNNTDTIKGRHETRFCSAFLIKTPILPGDIGCVEEVKAECFSSPVISLDSFLGRRKV